MSEAVVLVLISAVLGPMVVMWYGHKLRQENTSQHAEGRALQREILDHLGALDGRSEVMERRQVRIEGKLDQVVDWKTQHQLEHALHDY